MTRPEEDRNQDQLDRREFLRVGGLGAAALATGAAGCANVNTGTGTPAQAGPLPPAQVQAAPVPPAQAAQAQPARRPGSGFQRNFDPVPASEPSMNFAAFTDTHVGQKTRSPNWDFAEHLDLLADDIMDRTLPCEFASTWGTARSTARRSSTASGCRRI